MLCGGQAVEQMPTSEKPRVQFHVWPGFFFLPKFLKVNNMEIGRKSLENLANQEGADEGPLAENIR